MEARRDVSRKLPRWGAQVEASEATTAALRHASDQLAASATSTLALTNATLPFVLALADKGWERALAEDTHLRDGLNIYDGRVHHPTVAGAIGVSSHPWQPAANALMEVRR